MFDLAFAHWQLAVWHWLWLLALALGPRNSFGTPPPPPDDPPPPHLLSQCLESSHRSWGVE